MFRSSPLECLFEGRGHVCEAQPQRAALDSGMRGLEMWDHLASLSGPHFTAGSRGLEMWDHAAATACQLPPSFSPLLYDTSLRRHLNLTSRVFSTFVYLRLALPPIFNNIRRE